MQVLTMVRSENDIWRIVVELVRSGVAADHPGVQVKRVYQQATQSAGDGPLVTLYRIGNRKVGALGKAEKWQRDEQVMQQTETWRQELTIQAGAIVPQSKDAPAFTGADVLELLAVFLHGDAALARLAKEGVGILKITDIREIPFRDDADQFSINVNFDFTLTYTQSRIRTIPVFESEEIIIHRI